MTLAEKIIKVVGSHPRHEDVEGAPFRIGDKVKVTYLTDETAPRHLLGHVGMVEHFEYDCGCGQTFPGDPMIGVRFKTTFHEFWKEELTKI